MYEIYIYEEQENKVYNKLITYAMSKSDVFMNVTNRYEHEKQIIKREDYESEEEYKYFLNDFKESEQQAVIFNKSTEAFLKNLAPYLVKKRKYPTNWPCCKVVLGEFQTVDICIYGICNSVKKYLLKPKGLFNWRYPNYPDDLCFFKEGYCWFWVIAHEEQANIYVETIEEVHELRQMGLKGFQVSEVNRDKNDLFYEDYSY